MAAFASLGFGNYAAYFSAGDFYGEVGDIEAFDSSEAFKEKLYHLGSLVDVFNIVNGKLERGGNRAPCRVGYPYTEICYKSV